MKAWLITWEWSGEHAAVDDKVVGFLNPRWSEERVGEIIEFLYSQTEYNLTEFAAYTKNPKHKLYRPTCEKGIITCGHNPWLEARKVDKLDISIDPESGLETVTWMEKPKYKYNLRNNEPELIRGSIPGKFVRCIKGPVVKPR